MPCLLHFCRYVASTDTLKNILDLKCDTFVCKFEDDNLRTLIHSHLTLHPRLSFRLSYPIFLAFSLPWDPLANLLADGKRFVFL